MLLIPIMIKFVNLNCINSNFGNLNSVEIFIFLHWPDLDFLARLGLLGLAGNSWLGLLGRAEISWPDWDFLAWLGLLGLALTSWPGKDFLAF